MKYLLVLLVVVLGGWLLLRQRGAARGDVAPRKPKARTGPAAMVACAHCDLRLPQAEALFDPAGRPFCSDAHRIAGPR